MVILLNYFLYYKSLLVFLHIIYVSVDFHALKCYSTVKITKYRMRAGIRCLLRKTGAEMRIK